MPADSDTSSLYSLTNSVRESLYRLLGERRMQAVSESYQWPCDSAATRLELTCAAMAEATCKDGLCWNPRPGELEEVLSSTSIEPRRILDLGSGSTSSWAISMAERYPHAEVIGVDLVPSDLTYLPANLTIELHDLLEGLPYPDDYFSMVHARASAPAAFFDPDHSILPEIARVLRPGGILFLEELDDLHAPFYSPDPANPHLPLVLARHNLRQSLLASTMPQYLPRMTWGGRMAAEIRLLSDFARVVTRTMEVPVGCRTGEGPPELQLGSLNRAMWLDVWELNSVTLGWSEEQMREARELDEQVMGEEHKGLWIRAQTVWAVRG